MAFPIQIAEPPPTITTPSQPCDFASSTPSRTWSRFGFTGHSMRGVMSATSEVSHWSRRPALAILHSQCSNAGILSCFDTDINYQCWLLDLVILDLSSDGFYTSKTGHYSCFAGKAPHAGHRWLHMRSHYAWLDKTKWQRQDRKDKIQVWRAPRR
jgi:hypothetical protein